jgi:hypothetical protein
MKKILLLLTAVLLINIGTCTATQSEYIQGYNYGFNQALNNTFGLDFGNYPDDFVRGFDDGQADGQNYMSNMREQALYSQDY